MMRKFQGHLFALGSLLIFSCGTKQSHNANRTDSPSVTTEQKDTGVKPAENQPGQQNPYAHNSKFNLENIYGTWTYDVNAPEPDFRVARDAFYVYDNGEVKTPYEIIKDTVIVKYPSMTTKGLIVLSTKDSLVISWDNRRPTYYMRWKK